MRNKGTSFVQAEAMALYVAKMESRDVPIYRSPTGKFRIDVPFVSGQPAHTTIAHNN